VDVYHYRVANMISVVNIAPGVQQYQNGSRDHSTGVEAELRGKIFRDLEGAASFSYDVATDTGLHDYLPNSPHQIAKLRFSKPILKGRLTLSSSSQYLARRETVGEIVTRPVWLEDLTLTTHRLHPEFDLQFGIRNALNWRYQDPVYLVVDQMQQDGRSWFLKVIWHTRE